MCANSKENSTNFHNCGWFAALLSSWNILSIFHETGRKKTVFFNFLLCFLSNITHSLILGSLAETLRFAFLLMVMIEIQVVRDETQCLVVNTNSWPFREACYPYSHGVTSVTTIQPAMCKICMAVFGNSVLNCILEIQITHSQL